MRSKLIFIICLAVASCNQDILDGFEEGILEEENVEEEIICDKDTLIVTGVWKLESYFEILPNGDRIFYQNSRPQSSNYFPDDISGELRLTEDDQFNLRLDLIFQRTSDSTQTIAHNSLGGYWVDSNCINNRCAAYLNLFNTLTGEFKRDSMSQVCISGTESPLLHWSRIEKDSIVMYWEPE